MYICMYKYIYTYIYRERERDERGREEEREHALRQRLHVKEEQGTEEQMEGVQDQGVGDGLPKPQAPISKL